MTWPGEVAHVAWKDLRQQRWLVLAYVALIAVATWRAVRVAHAMPTPNVLSGVMMVVVIFGCILSAIVMQGDSPTRADSFWLTRPFRASAVLGAKFLVIGGVIVLLPLIGEAAGLLGFGLDAASIPGMLFACLAVFGVWLLLSMLLGAITRDLRSTVVAFILVIAATGIASGLLMTGTPRALRLDWIQPLFLVLTLLGAFATLITLYLRRGRALYAWLAACLTTACAFITAFSSAMPSVAGRTLTVGPLALAVHDPSIAAQSGKLALTITAPSAPDSLSSRFFVSEVVVTLRDGSRLPLTRPNATVEFRTVKLPVASGTRWLGSSSGDRPSSFEVELSEREMTLISRGISSVEVDGLVTIERPRVIGVLALRPNAVLRSAGRRTRIDNIGETGGRIKLELTSVGLELERFNMRGNPFVTSDGSSFALVNDRRGEAIPLLANGSGNSSDYLVLPGTSLSQNTFRLESFIRPVDGTTLTDGWYRDARLVFAAYQSVGSYSATARASVD